MSHSELIEIEMQMHSSTQKTILVSDDGNDDDTVWLPLSQIQTPQKGGAKMNRYHAGVAGHEGRVDLMPIVIGARS